MGPPGSNTRTYCSTVRRLVHHGARSGADRRQRVTNTRIRCLQASSQTATTCPKICASGRVNNMVLDLPSPIPHSGSPGARASTRRCGANRTAAIPGPRAPWNLRTTCQQRRYPRRPGRHPERDNAAEGPQQAHRLVARPAAENPDPFAPRSPKPPREGNQWPTSVAPPAAERGSGSSWAGDLIQQRTEQRNRVQLLDGIGHRLPHHPFN